MFVDLLDDYRVFDKFLPRPFDQAYVGKNCQSHFHWTIGVTRLDYSYCQVVQYYLSSHAKETGAKTEIRLGTD